MTVSDRKISDRNPLIVPSSTTQGNALLNLFKTIDGCSKLDDLFLLLILCGILGAYYSPENSFYAYALAVIGLVGILFTRFRKDKLVAVDEKAAMNRVSMIELQLNAAITALNRVSQIISQTDFVKSSDVSQPITDAMSQIKELNQLHAQQVDLTPKLTALKTP